MAWRPSKGPSGCANEVISRLRSDFEEFATLLLDRCAAADNDLFLCCSTFLHAFRTAFEKQSRLLHAQVKAALECGTDVISACRADFDCATATFYNECGAKDYDPLAYLLNEIVSMCFRLLSLRDCISASQVCRAWRAATLSDRRLWNNYDAPSILRSGSFLIPLTLFLSTSDPVPFHLKYSSRGYGDDDGVIDAVSRNMSRMAELTLNIGISQLLSLDAPLLRRVDARHGLGQELIMLSPAQWELRNVSRRRLEHLALDLFSLPPDCPPFTALRTLYAHPPLSDGPISFIRVFPNLTKLELHHVTQGTLVMVSPLPSCINVVRLMSTASVAGVIDYSHFFQSCTHSMCCKISKLYICYSSTIFDALELFVTVVPGVWTMQLSMANYLILQAADSDSSWTVHCRDSILFSRDWPREPVIQRLSELTMPLPDFLGLCSLHNGERRLPSLQCLTLLVDSKEDMHSGECNNPIQMPALSSLTFSGHYLVEDMDDYSADASALLTKLLRSSDVLLAVIDIKLPVTARVSLGDASHLLQFAKRVIARSFAFEAAGD